MFEDYPHRTHDAYLKAYYLLQASYWAQQAIVLCLQLEKPRKDFKELVAHHIVTLALIGLSYRFHFTYMGLAVYITHDISDFFLAVSNDLLNCLLCPHLELAFRVLDVATKAELSTDIQNLELSQFLHHDSLLQQLCPYLGVFSTLH